MDLISESYEKLDSFFGQRNVEFGDRSRRFVQICRLFLAAQQFFQLDRVRQSHVDQNGLQHRWSHSILIKSVQK